MCQSRYVAKQQERIRRMSGSGHNPVLMQSHLRPEEPSLSGNEKLALPFRSYSASLHFLDVEGGRPTEHSLVNRMGAPFVRKVMCSSPKESRVPLIPFPISQFNLGLFYLQIINAALVEFSDPYSIVFVRSTPGGPHQGHRMLLHYTW